MGVFQFTTPDGQTFEITAPDQEAAIEAFRQFQPPTGGVSVNRPAAQELASNLDRVATDTARTMLDGLNFGWSDNLDGIRRGILFGENTDANGDVSFGNYDIPMGERYANIRDERRADLAQSAERSPAASVVGNILGGTIPSTLMAPAVAGNGLLSMVGRMAGIGGLEGSLIGAGYADGENVGDNAMWGGLLGAATGGLAVPVASAVRQAGRATGGVLSAVTGRGNEARAGNAIARAFNRAGMDIPTLERRMAEARAVGQDMYRPMDMDASVLSLMNGVIRQPSEAQDYARAFVDLRNSGSGQRVANQIADATGVSETAAQTLQRLTQARRETAKQLYDRAAQTSGPVQVDNALALIDNRLALMANDAGIEGDAVDQMFRRFRARLAGETPDGSNVMLSDPQRVTGVFRQVGDAIDKATLENQGYQVEQLTALKQALMDALTDASDDFRIANNTYREMSAPIDALAEGRAALAPRARYEDQARTFSTMTREEQAAFTSGLQDTIFGRIERQPVGSTTVARNVTDIPQTTNLLRMATNSQRAGPNIPAPASSGGFMDDLQRYLAETKDPGPGLFGQLARERQMERATDVLTGGSRTANNLADQVDTAEGAIMAGARAAQSPTRAAVDAVVAALGNAAQGRDEATRAIIARALLAEDPVAALRPLVTKANATERGQRAIEGIIRQAAQQGRIAMTAP